jgi:hypothetical protein
MCLADELAAASQKYKKHTCSVLPTYCSINQGDISLNIFLLILSMQFLPREPVAMSATF